MISNTQFGDIRYYLLVSLALLAFASVRVILNENMTNEQKLYVIQMLIDKGCDVNWLNYQRETALLIALERIEIDIANLLLDNGAVIYKE
ncbi:MAG: hypothetical protein E7010_04755 [Alphaproteobacteria bacterium]|nr:hypothetical protein [Alphaproteobacteria bacterium]